MTSTERERLAIVARRAPLPPFSGIGLIVHHITTRLARRVHNSIERRLGQILPIEQ